MNDKVICIMGPTASGKTELGVKLAKRIAGEIISADSMQIYRGLDIATAKVTKDEMQDIKHHLIDICEPYQKFSVADFKAMCYDKIQEIIKRGKVPIIVGGTGLYISSVINNMEFEEQEVDVEYRKYLYDLANEKSNTYVYDILKEIDPESASKIHPNNLKRVVRAIEIAKLTGKTKSKHMDEEIKRIEKETPKYTFYPFYIDIPREILYERINKRVDFMVENGLVEEARKVYNMKLSSDNTCMQAIGYKEFFEYFENTKSLEECIEKLKQETRRYAKRQETWFKNKLDVIKLELDSSKDNMVEQILKLI